VPILFPLAKLNLAGRRGAAPLFAAGRLLPASRVTITGVSRDASGVALGGCLCTLFRVTTNGPLPVYTQLAQVTSDGSGNYAFTVGTNGPYRVTFDLAGAPILAGITLNTLTGV